MTISATNLITTIAGVNYKVSLYSIDDRRGVSVQVQRVRKDGSKVWAFLSARQRAAEMQAKRRFANEINAHIGA